VRAVLVQSVAWVAAGGCQVEARGGLATISCSAAALSTRLRKDTCYERVIRSLAATGWELAVRNGATVYTRRADEAILASSYQSSGLTARA